VSIDETDAIPETKKYCKSNPEKNFVANSVKPFYAPNGAVVVPGENM